MTSIINSLQLLDFSSTPDGRPLVQNSISEFWSDFPYDRSSKLAISLWLDPRVVILLTVGYLASIPFLKFVFENLMRGSAKEQEAQWLLLFNESKTEKERRLKKAQASNDTKAISKAKADLESFSFEKFKKTASPGFNGTKSPTFNALVAFHNFVLVIFSAAVMIKATPVVFGVIRQKGFMAAYCDKDKSMWNGTSFGYWATIFYLSKFYEFIDTWVLIAKCSTSNGQRVQPSLLQVYHHAGVALTMWSATVTQGAWIAWVVVMNSTVHTIMYTYFFASVFGYKSPYAQYLTSLQLIQFMTGIIGTMYILVLGEECDSGPSRAGLLGMQLYAVGLLFLFASFFKRKYKGE